MATNITTPSALMDEARLAVGKSIIDLEPSAILELYELYFDIELEPFRFHAGTNNLANDIIWNGNKYYTSAIEVEGFEANINGRLPRPKVSVANSDYIISNILRDYSDFRNGKFVRVKVFLKHLDNENFDSNQNPFGSPNPYMYISKEKYLISQKLIENKQLVQFELITPFDLESLQTATRAIYGRYCYWQYRGMGCNYQGDLIEKDDESAFENSPTKHIKGSSGNFLYTDQETTINKYLWQLEVEYAIGDIVCIRNIDFNGFKDPPISWFVCRQPHKSTKFIIPHKSIDYWEKDGCSKTIQSCKKRFGMVTFIDARKNTFYNDFDASLGILPFGGFPGTDKFRYE
jgi:lambda family phage minor tail protein L